MGDVPTLIAVGATAAPLAFADRSTLWQDDFTTLRTYDTETLAVQTIATTSETLGQLDYENGALYASVTDFGTNRSSVFAVTPEPSSALLLGLALSGFASRRRRR